MDCPDLPKIDYRAASAKEKQKTSTALAHKKVKETACSLICNH